MEFEEVARIIENIVRKDKGKGPKGGIRKKEGIPMTLEELMDKMKEWSKEENKSLLPSRFKQGDKYITLKGRVGNYSIKPKIM